MVATLGRALAALGERVLLADTSALSLLPFYFGLAAPPPDELLLIPPLATAFEEPLQLVTYQLGGGEIGGSTRQRLVESLVRDSRAAHLILIDLDASPADLLAARQDLPGPLVLLIPLAPDMKSVLALQAIEAMLGNSAAAARSPAGASGSADRADGSAPTTHYVLTQFDPTQSLHVDVREVLRARLGDRLLPLTISRASAVAEALAEGMTILEYAPASAVAEEYRQLAAWLHRAAFAGQAAEADERRSED